MSKTMYRTLSVNGILGLGLLVFIIGSGCAAPMAVQNEPTLENIPPQTAYELMQAHQNDENFVILDVRTPEELVATGYLENAINLNYMAETFQDELKKLDKNKTYLVYCRSGGRSGRMSAFMEELRFQHVFNMTGGILQWTQEDLPLVKDAAGIQVCCSEE